MADETPEVKQARVPTVTFRTADGVLYRVHPGGLLGRLATAALRVEDPRISEAHALLSLRGEVFRLIGLRGTLSVGRGWVGEILIEQGQEILLAEGIALYVEDVALPESVLTLEGLQQGRLALNQPEWSIYHATSTIRPGVERDADTWIWCTGDQWWIREGDGEADPLLDGDDLRIGEQEVRVRSQNVAVANTSATERSGQVLPPLDVDMWPGHTEICMGSCRVVLTGRIHDILRQTALLTQPPRPRSVHWSEVAGRIWKANPTEDNWYRNCRRLARRLQAERLPAELFNLDNGQVYLRIRPEVDRLELHEDPERA